MESSYPTLKVSLFSTNENQFGFRPDQAFKIKENHFF
jgi:hypothetical protein